MTKKVKPAKKAKKPADKTPEITKAAKALENYLKENNLDPACLLYTSPSPRDRG